MEYRRKRSFTNFNGDERRALAFIVTIVVVEYAARGKEGNPFPWTGDESKNDKGCFFANFKPDKGNYTEDGNLP